MKITIRSASEVVFETTTTWTLGQLVGKVVSSYLHCYLYPTKRESDAVELTVSCLHKYVITVDALDARYITFQEKKMTTFQNIELGSKRSNLMVSFRPGKKRSYVQPTTTRCPWMSSTSLTTTQAWSECIPLCPAQFQVSQPSLNFWLKIGSKDYSISDLSHYGFQWVCICGYYVYRHVVAHTIQQNWLYMVVVWSSSK
jgi:hypothetical protein